MKIEIENHRLLIEHDGRRVNLPAGRDAVDRVPHLARVYLQTDELVLFESLLGVFGGCAGVTVRKRDE